MDPTKPSNGGDARDSTSMLVARELPRKLKQGACLVEGRRVTGHGESDRDSSFRQARAALELAGWSVRALHAQLEIAGFGMDAAGNAEVRKTFVDLDRRYLALLNGWQALRDAAGENIPVLWRQFVAACKAFRDAELHAYPKLVREEVRHASKRISMTRKSDAAVGRACRALVAQSPGVFQ